jgi:hypothetical protein
VNRDRRLLFGADYIPGENDDGEYRISRAPPEHAQDPTLWVYFRVWEKGHVFILANSGWILPIPRNFPIISKRSKGGEHDKNKDMTSFALT